MTIALFYFSKYDKQKKVTHTHTDIKKKIHFPVPRVEIYCCSLRGSNVLMITKIQVVPERTILVKPEIRDILKRTILIPTEIRVESTRIRVVLSETLAVSYKTILIQIEFRVVPGKMILVSD